MSHEERNTVAGLIAGILVNAWVILKLRRMFADGRLGGDDAVQVWAQAMLWVIPVGIALVIVVTILFCRIAWGMKAAGSCLRSARVCRRSSPATGLCFLGLRAPAPTCQGPSTVGAVAR